MAKNKTEEIILRTSYSNRSPSGYVTNGISEHNPYREEFIAISTEFEKLLEKMKEDNKTTNQPMKLSLELVVNHTQPHIEEQQEESSDIK